MKSARPEMITYFLLVANHVKVDFVFMSLSICNVFDFKGIPKIRNENKNLSKISWDTNDDENNGHINLNFW